MKRLLLATAAMLVSATAADAATMNILFAQDFQMGQADTIQFVNNGDGTGYLQDFNNPVVLFAFNDPSLPSAFVSAVMNITGASGGASTVAAAGLVGPAAADGSFTQWLGAGRITFTALTPQTGFGGCVGTCTNLLTVDFGKASIRGNIPGTSGTYIGSDATNPTDAVTFTSDFFDFSAAWGENFSLALSGVSPQFSQNGGIIDSFTADSAGTFNYDIDVPEPAMIGLFGLGAIGLGFARRRKN